MAGLIYNYIALDSATLIQRKHPRDIELPGMVDIKNLIISRSDKTLTLRPDLSLPDEEVLAIGSKLRNGDVTEVEFLNSIVGLYGTGELIWITSTVPVITDGRSIKCSTLDSNGTTVTVTGGLSADEIYLCTLSSSSIINASEDIWAGCYIKFGTSSLLFRISSVLSELEFYIDESPGSQTDVDFEIYRPHNILNSTRKANIQTFGSNIIYSVPCGVDNSTLNRVSGPFYTVTTPATSTPGGYIYTVDSYDTGVDAGVENNMSPKFFTMDSPVDEDTRYWGITPQEVPTTESPVIITATATEILDEEDWTEVTDTLLAAPGATIQFGDMTSDGTDIYLSGEIRDHTSETFSEGFEVADGYTVGNQITETSAWAESTLNDAGGTAEIISIGGEQAVNVSLTGTFTPNTKEHGYSWTDAISTLSPTGWTPPLVDIYTRFKINMGLDSSPQTEYTSVQYKIGWGTAAYDPHYFWGFAISARCSTNSGNESSTNHFELVFNQAGSSQFDLISRDVIYPQHGEIYRARLTSYLGDDGDTIWAAKVWQGDLGDEPAEYMAFLDQGYWSSSAMRPTIITYFYGVDDDLDLPGIVVYYIDVEYSSKYEIDRTTFVHKFDNSSSPSFSDVSPASSFTGYKDTSDFRSHFVYDTNSSSLVLGLIDSANWLNRSISDVPLSTSWIRYSTDSGSSWSTPASMVGYFPKGLFYSALDSKLYAPCIAYTDNGSTLDDWDFVIRQSDDGGATWTDYVALGDKLGEINPPNSAFGFFEDDTNWCLLFPNGYYLFGGTYAAEEWDSGAIAINNVKFLNSAGTDGSSYDAIAFLCAEVENDGQYLYSLTIDTSGETVNWNSGESGDASPGSFWSYIYPLRVSSWSDRLYIGLCPQRGPSTPNNVYYSTIDVEEAEGTSSEAEISVFYPVSSDYRSNVFSVLDGYLVLFGTAEYDSGDDAWTYTTRRIRWTAPNAVTDFSGVGSGLGEVPGNGIFLDARPVNGRIVTFETSSIGALVPRGIVADPWDYDVIFEGIKILSNPCVVEDKCYFIASDGLLYMTNGISVVEAGSSFDMSVFDDFEENSPIWLVYAPKFNSLIAYYSNTSSTTNNAYLINLVTGSVSSFTLPESDIATTSTPRSVVAIENSSDQRVFVSYDRQGGGIGVKLSSSDTYDDLVIGELSPGDEITGVDTLWDSGDDHYWYGQFDTGNIFIVEEGVKVALKHIIIHTYTDTDSVTDNPDILVEVKSIEDSSWSGPRDTDIDGHITVSTTACTIDSSAPPSALSNKLGTATGSSITYNLPWLATNCRVYTETGGTYTACTLVTTTPDAANEYQITAAQQIKVYGTNGHSVYCFCENEPAIKAGAGDYVGTDEGLHRINSITNYTAAVLDRYKASGTDTDASHYTAEQMPIGHGQIKLGINKLVEGVQLRIMICPRHGTGAGTGQPTIAKITGISFGYIPLGEKILEATGG